MEAEASRFKAKIKRNSRLRNFNFRHTRMWRFPFKYFVFIKIPIKITAEMTLEECEFPLQVYPPLNNAQQEEIDLLNYHFEQYSDQSFLELKDKLTPIRYTEFVQLKSQYTEIKWYTNGYRKEGSGNNVVLSKHGPSSDPNCSKPNLTLRFLVMLDDLDNFSFQIGDLSLF